MKIKIGKIYKLNLDNYPGWTDTKHKETAYANCHQQLAKLVDKQPQDQSRARVQMLSGPRKYHKILVAKTWFSSKAKIPCDCSLLVVLNRGCQNMGIHE